MRKMARDDLTDDDAIGHERICIITPTHTPKPRDPLCSPARPLDDLVVLVTASGARVFAPPRALAALRPVLARWRGVHVYCIEGGDLASGGGEAEEALVDAAEEFKVRAFVDMLGGLSSLAIPLAGADPFEIEMWPLVQAYGLDGFGKSGFFTMNFGVSDATPLLDDVLGRIDAAALAEIADQGLPVLMYHWQTTVGNLCGRGGVGIDNRSETTLAEPILSYFHYAASRDPAIAAKRAPRLLLGPRTALLALLDSNGGTAGDSSHLGGESDGAVTPASLRPAALRHLVIEANQPLGPLHPVRTYFFEPRPGTDRCEHAEVRRIAAGYAALARAVRRCIAEWSPADAWDAHAAVRDRLEADSDAAMCELASLVVALDARDGLNRAVSASAGTRETASVSRAVITLRASVLCTAGGGSGGGAGGAGGGGGGSAGGGGELVAYGDSFRAGRRRICRAGRALRRVRRRARRAPGTGV
jgi:hypothetical protein